jgi:glyoxylase-like metal-dependent hydrolase (beta-lactamase superfamily II)
MQITPDGGGTAQKLAALGLGPGDITDIILSHLHFDHAGGTTHVADGVQSLAWPNATVHVQRRQWEKAHAPTIRERGSFVAGDYDALIGSGKLHLLDGDCEVLPGIFVHEVSGHTPGMQIVEVRSSGRTLCYMADLVPSSGHIRLAYVTSYDVQPLVTVEEKRKWLGAAMDGGWVVAFGHDPATPACTLVRGADGEAVVGERVELA